jgi:hypothetical protein
VTTWGKTEDFTLGELTRTELEDVTTQHVCAPTYWEHTTNGWVAKENYGGRDKNNQGYGAQEAMAHKLNTVGVNKVIQSAIMPTALFVFTYANCTERTMGGK